MSAAGSHGRYGKLGVKARRHGGQIGDGLQVLREHVERPVGDLVVLGGAPKAGHACRIAHPLQQRGRLLQPREHPERGLAEAGSESLEPVHLDRGVAPRPPSPPLSGPRSHAALPALYPSQPGAPSRRPSRCCRASSAPRGPCGWSCCRTPSTSARRATLSGWPVGDPGAATSHRVSSGVRQELAASQQDRRLRHRAQHPQALAALCRPPGAGRRSGAPRITAACSPCP